MSFMMVDTLKNHVGNLVANQPYLLKKKLTLMIAHKLKRTSSYTMSLKLDGDNVYIYS